MTHLLGGRRAHPYAGAVPSGPRARAADAIRHLDDRGGLSRTLVRTAWAAGKTVRDTVAHRSPVTTRWAPGEQRWHYRWPEARVNDPGRWADAHDWSTFGARYDMDDLLWRRYRPAPGDVVLDVGAGHGGETMRLAHLVGPTGRVVAVEAAPGPFARLDELVRLNGWAHVEPVQVALAAEPGTLTISDDDEGWIAGNVYEGRGVEVRATTVDDLCAELGIEHVDWLKMNIEGAEKEVVLGMERMAPHVRHLTISCHDFLGTEWGRSLAPVTAWLREHGYTVEQRGDGDFVQQLYVYAWR